MGRKSSAKAQTQTPPPAAPPEPKRFFSRLLISAVVVLALISGGVLYWRQASGSSDVAQAATPAAAPVYAEVQEVAKRPHKQATLPQLQFPGYPVPRSAEVVA